MRQERLLLMYSSNNSLLRHMAYFTQLVEKTELPYTYPYITVASYSLSLSSLYILHVCMDFLQVLQLTQLPQEY